MQGLQFSARLCRADCPSSDHYLTTHLYDAQRIYICIQPSPNMLLPNAPSLCNPMTAALTTIGFFISLARTNADTSAHLDSCILSSPISTPFHPHLS